jgi:hypothetical protein
MPVPTVITDLSTTAASNFPAGSDAPSTIDDTLRAHGAFIKQLYDGPLVPASGSAGAPAYAFLSDANNGWYAPAADTQSWSLGGVEKMRLNSIGLGIGETPAAGKLVVKNGGGGDWITGDNLVASFKGGVATDVVGTRNLLSLSTYTPSATNYANTQLLLSATNNSSSNGTAIVHEGSTGDLTFRTGQSGVPSADTLAGTVRARVTSGGDFIAFLNTSAPSLTTNQTMVFTLTSDTNLRISVRGSDGATRTVNLTLA